MILIADSGSTKTDWRMIVDENKIYKFQTVGLNPFFIDSLEIAKNINETFASKLNNIKIDKIYFYGAGCASSYNRNIVKQGISKVFKNADIFVYTDLLCAARSLFGNEKGIVAILGTGSNTACFDGEKITENISSLGYILGDEGSGAYLGKIFISDFLNNELPCQLGKKFFKEYGLTKDNILEAIYFKPFPNRFLSSFTKFLFNNKNDKYVLNLLEYNFNQFFDKTIRQLADKMYDKQTIRCVGSIAFYFEDVLKFVALKRNIIIDKIIKNPIDNLVNYHLKRL